MGKIKGLEITDLRIGTGAEATPDNCVAVNVRMFLRRGDEVFFSPALGSRLVIALWRRDCIAGLLKGIPGMRVGGLRQIIISPHLAYGEAGVPGRIPANAMLRCEVELAAIREHTALLPEDYQPGRVLRVSKPDSQNYSIPQWSLVIHEYGNSLLIFPMRDSTPLRWFQTSVVLDPAKAASIIQIALDEPRHLPEGCIQWDSGRLDIPRRGSLPVRDKVTQAPCIVVSVSERNDRILDYAVPETSENLEHSPLFKLLSELVTPHLDPPTEASSQS